MPEIRDISIYTHIPFCAKKCIYCDFFSGTDFSEELVKRYCYSLQKELKLYGEKLEDKNLISLYIGGGTPSVINKKYIKNIVSDASEMCHIRDAEITIEMNPEDITKELIGYYLDLGINRFSIGVQSFHERDLKLLQRRTNERGLMDKLEVLKTFEGLNYNLDLIYGLPYQDLSAWEDNLQRVVAYNPSHISVYGLGISEGTQLHKIKDTLDFPSDDESFEMYEMAINYLASCGYMQYEISNFAKPGNESRHNLCYWQLKDYIGIGAAASSCYGKLRWTNTEKIEKYTSRLNHGLSPADSFDEVDNISRMNEYIMLSLRLKSGLSINELISIWGFNILDEREKELSLFVKNGLIKIAKNSIVLTNKGFWVSNDIIRGLIYWRDDRI